ncbi:protein neprosin-like [Lycium barbarum]|uniref:protein neprosin-like n=1 Tax=Lycium barbarum TaxID=112863 RepID=UPI00293E975E|nr:protein neprosin-like [Lycium barbarum]
MCLLVSYDGVKGEMKLSKLEELALEKQLKLLNKPSVKTIKTGWGDTYDCVDFYKQPAFDHPSLKNHNFHPGMKPTLTKISKFQVTQQLMYLRIHGQGMTVVLLELFPSKELQKMILLGKDTNNNLKATGVYTRAIVQTRDDPNNKFAGAGMVASLWNPRVEGTQNSASRMKIQKGSDRIQVDPMLYGDTETRLFIHFQAGKTHCFNTICSGFVLVNSDIAIDGVFHSVTRKGKTIWETALYIDRDLANGNWWLLIGKDQVQVGFWPQRIFTELDNFATSVEWGGVTYTPACRCILSSNGRWCFPCTSRAPS